jgi:hypothetical protein
MKDICMNNTIALCLLTILNISLMTIAVSLMAIAFAALKLIIMLDQDRDL